ncbi:hypothetical protein [Caballeronia sp. LZ034LL]|uniref:hypothetical protein n=1 Tax=Caballeronia sp. LZ034LL TaxID=3038567 RepID=UPI00285FBFA6|nr:hypothetical protein [Caballeronia sp. LZ034LL]MDR5836082.1 hypothetical protein [Caballeronia sp. LZ034LL]
MSHFLTHCWHALSGPATRLRGRFGTRAAGVDAAARSPLQEAATRADRLECIALYARAGYFGMSHTADGLQLHTEAPLH